MSQATATTPAQKEIPRLVHGFNGLFGPVAIEMVVIFVWAFYLPR
jgi:hypothetical protein